jgi:hypothetical protein
MKTGNLKPMLSSAAGVAVDTAVLWLALLMSIVPAYGVLVFTLAWLDEPNAHRYMIWLGAHEGLKLGALAGLLAGTAVVWLRRGRKARQAAAGPLTWKDRRGIFWVGMKYFASGLPALGGVLCLMPIFAQLQSWALGASRVTIPSVLSFAVCPFLVALCFWPAARLTKQHWRGTPPVGRMLHAMLFVAGLCSLLVFFAAGIGGC